MTLKTFYTALYFLFLTLPTNAGLIELSAEELLITHKQAQKQKDSFFVDEDGGVLTKSNLHSGEIFASPLRIAKEKVLAPFRKTKGVTASVPDDVRMHSYGEGKSGAIVENVFMELSFKNRGAVINFCNKFREQFVCGYKKQKVNPAKHLIEFTRKIDFSGCGIMKLPVFVEELKHLNELDLSNNNFRNVPSALKNMRHIKRIDMRGNPINGDLLKEWTEEERFILDWTPQEKAEPWY